MARARDAGHEVRVALPDDPDLSPAEVDVTGLGLSVADLATDLAGGKGAGVRVFRESQTALDVGTGDGLLASEPLKKVAHVTGHDLDATALESARRRDPDVPWIQGDVITAPVPPGSFDVDANTRIIEIARPSRTEACRVGSCYRHIRRCRRDNASEAASPAGKVRLPAERGREGGQARARSTEIFANRMTDR